MQTKVSRGGTPPRRQGDIWERWQHGVIQFLVLVLKVISAAAIIAVFAITEYAAVKNVARVLTTETEIGTPVPSISRTSGRLDGRMAEEREKKTVIDCRCPPGK